MIDAAPSPPYPALLLQIFRDAKYMLDVRLAPLLRRASSSPTRPGTRSTPTTAPIVMAAAKNVEKRLLGDAPKLDADSIATMKTRGLTVTTLDPKTAASFRDRGGGLREVDARQHGAGRRLRRGRSRARRVPQDPRSRCGRSPLAPRTRSRRSPSAASCCCRWRRSCFAAFTSTGIPGAAPFTLNLTLWVGLLGAAIAAREGKLLTLATGEFLPKGRITEWAHVVGGFAGAAIAMMFAVGGLALVLTERAAGDEIALGVPVRGSPRSPSPSASR